MRGDAGSLDCLIRRVQAEHVGAAYELLDLAVLEQRDRIEVGDLAADATRPIRRVPLADRRQRRAPAAYRVPDLRRLLAGRAQARRRPVTTIFGWFAIAYAIPGRPSTSSRVAEDQAAVRAAEAEGVGHRHAHSRRRGSPRTMSRSQSGSSSREVRVDRQHRRGESPSAQTAASTAPAAAIRWPMTLLVELTATTCASCARTPRRTAAHSLRSFIGVDVPCAFT